MNDKKVGKIYSKYKIQRKKYKLIILNSVHINFIQCILLENNQEFHKRCLLK